MPSIAPTSLFDLASRDPIESLWSAAEFEAAQLGFASWVDAALVPALERLGHASTADELPPKEVLAIYRRLAGAARHVAQAPLQRVSALRAVVLVTPTNAHTLAADLLERLLRGEGYVVDSLHPNDLDGDLFGGNPPEVIAISAGLESEWRGLPAYLAEIRKHAPRALILVGGGAIRIHCGTVLPEGAVPCLGFAQAMRALRRRAPVAATSIAGQQAAASM